MFLRVARTRWCCFFAALGLLPAGARMAWWDGSKATKGEGVLTEAACSALWEKAWNLWKPPVSDEKRAGRAYRKVVDKCKETAPTRHRTAMFNLASIYMSLGRQDKAEPILTELQREPKKWSVWNLAKIKNYHADSLLIMGQYKQALGQFLSAIQMWLRTPFSDASMDFTTERMEAVRNIADTLKVAASRLDRMASETDDFQVSWGAGLFLLEVGLASKAWSHFKVALHILSKAHTERSAEDAEFYVDAARAASAVGELRQVLSCSQQALALNSSRLDAWLQNAWVLERLRGETAALEVYRRGFLECKGPSPQALELTTRFVHIARKNRLDTEADAVAARAIRHGILLDALQMPSHMVYGLPASPWYDKNTRAASILSANYEAIRAEIMACTSCLWDAAMPDTEGLSEGRWRELNLYHLGRKDERNCALLPGLNAILEEIPEAMSQVKGGTKVSMIYPGTVLRPHSGPSNTRLRLHLAISIPDPTAASIRVGTEWRRWAEGSMLAFDDSFQHEARVDGQFHRGSQLRIVLIVDIWHPALSDERIRKSLTIDEEERYTHRLDMYHSMRTRKGDRVEL